MQVVMADRATCDAIDDEFGGVGGGHEKKQRPQTAQSKLLDGAQAVKAKQMMFSDSPGKKEAPKLTKKAGEKPNRPATAHQPYQP